MTNVDAHFRLRLSPELHAAMKSAAEANNRSINSEIVSRLEKSLLMTTSEASAAKDAEILIERIIDRVLEKQKAGDA